MDRQEGQFALLLDAQFDVLWQSATFSDLLGHPGVVGRNGLDFIHPEDVEIALDTMVLLNERQGLFAQDDVRYAPAGADLRIIDVDGRWHTFHVTVYNYLDDPTIGAILCRAHLVRDRSDVGRAIELLATGAEMEAVLNVVARFADRSMGTSTQVAIAWRESAEDGTEVLHTTSASDAVALDPALAATAALAWRLGGPEPLVIDRLDDARLEGVGEVAAAAGYRAAFVVPIEAPITCEVIGGVVLWSDCTLDFQSTPQAPLHLAVRLAALAIADSRHKRALRWAAAHDPLTGLPNRAEFARRLDAEADGDLVLLYIDLDDFKPINDRHGHPVGDMVLIEVARRIAAVIGADDTVGRLGGDEFAVVCPGADVERGRRVAERIVSEIRRPILCAGTTLRVGASVGLALGAQPLIPALLVQQADAALYAAKSSGKNAVRIAS